MSVFRRNRMLLELAPSEGPSDPGVSGPGAPPGGSDPQPPASPEPRLEFVRPDEGEPARVGEPRRARAPAPAAAAGPRPPQTENAIPHSRVQEMLAARDAHYQAQFQALVQHLQPKPDDKKRMAQQLASIISGEPLPEEQEAERPMTRREFQAAMQGMQQQFGNAITLRQEMDEATRSLDAFKAKHADLFEDNPKLERHLISMWGGLDNVPMAKVCEEYVEALNGFYDARTRRYAGQKQLDATRRPVRAGPAPAGPSRPRHDLATEAGQDAALDEILSGDD